MPRANQSRSFFPILVSLFATGSLLAVPLQAIAQEAAPGEAEIEQEAPEQDAPEEAVAPETSEEAAAASARIEIERLREELSEELRDEIRLELRAEMQAELDSQREALRGEVRDAVAAEIAAQPAEPRRWVAEPAPRPTFFEVDGYLRSRGDIFVNLDMNAGLDVHGNALFPSPTDLDSDTLMSANQRLRVEPTFHVSEELRIRSTVDVLDNVVWGQNPDLYPRNTASQSSPLLVFSDSQVTPMAGINAARDSLMVKRVWGEVHTPLGFMHFGRMPSHWGLGMLVNDGDDIDSDYGTTVDRLMFIFPIGNGFMIPVAFDLLSIGPLYRPRDVYQGQPFDLENRDNAVQWMAAFARKDSEEEIRRQVLDGRMVINYGVYGLLRRQALDYVGPEPTALPRLFNDPIYMDSSLSEDHFVRRDALLVMPDLWFRLQTSRLRVEVEAAAVIGKVGNGRLRTQSETADSDEVSVTQFGAVAQGEYSFLRERLRVGLETGFASGDRAPGMGTRAAPGGRDAYPEEGAIDGRQYNVDPELGPIDASINNFRFHRAYHIDEILWRRVIGQVTDAIYVRPSLSYDLAPAFGFDVAAIYSRAVFVESTPGGSADLGLELNLGLRYQSRDGFMVQGVWGILFPFGGLELEEDRGTNIAQVIRGVAAITF